MKNIPGRTRAEKISFTLLLLFLVSCGDLPKEGDGSEKVEVKVHLEYDNVTQRIGPLIKYLEFAQ
jgi:hypothetical protein